MMVKGTRFLSVSFLEGLVVWKYVLGFDKSLVTDFEVQCQSSSSIHWSLVLQLCSSHLLTEELVEGVKINGVFSSSFRGKVLFWVDRDVGVVALVGEEGRDASGSVQSIVVQELCKGQEFRPVVLLVVAIDV